MFWINETKFSTKSEGLGAVNYIGFHVWTLALGGIQHGDKIGILAWQWEYFEIQKWLACKIMSIAWCDHWKNR